MVKFSYRERLLFACYAELLAFPWWLFALSSLLIDYYYNWALNGLFYYILFDVAGVSSLFSNYD